MHLRLSLLLLVCVSCLCAAQAAPVDPPKAFTVHGRVLQDPGGQPLRKVDVAFVAKDHEEHEKFLTSTDAEGKFEIENVKPGTYMTVLERFGFLQLGGHGHFGATLILGPEEPKDVVLRMQAASIITGKIVESDGDPIPNASVEVMQAVPKAGQGTSAQGNGNTNDLGEFRIANLAPGKYLLKVSAFGRSKLSPRVDPEKEPSKGELTYVPTYYPGTLDKSQATAVELHSGDETSVTFSPLESATFFIRGTAVTPGGAESVSLALNSSDGHNTQSAGLRQDGSFEFRNLLPGTYSLYLIVMDKTALNDAQQSRWLQITRLGRPLEITNANLDGLRLVPEVAGRVRGRFRMDKGQRMDWTRLEVTLMPVDAGSQFEQSSFSGALPTAQVKTDGSFEFLNVAAGEYRLAIASQSNALQDYFTKAVNLEGKDVADAGFSVSGGTNALDIVMGAEGGVIEGNVVDAKGDPVSLAVVVAAPNGKRRLRFDVFGSGSSDAQGHLHLRGLIPGEYTVLAWEEFDGNVRDPEFIISYQDRGQKVQVDEGDHKNVSLKAIPAGDDSP